MNAHNTKSPAASQSHGLPPSGIAGAERGATSATYSGRLFVRVAGEGFDADQVTPPCEECGLDEYSCECEVESWPAGPVMPMDEVRERIARFFAPDVKRTGANSYRVEL